MEYSQPDNFELTSAMSGIQEKRTVSQTSHDDFI